MTNDLRAQWVAHCLTLSARRADLYSGCRKIIRGHKLTFTQLDASLTLADSGYTSNKMRYLERAYVHPESLRVAVDLWGRRREQDRYGSVGVTCYNHFIKSEKTSRHSSVMGPCIQAFTVTYLDKRRYSVDVFYRTTELLKKFPADLVFLRERLLEPFDFAGMKLEGVHCHFANITMHPMYFVTILPHLEDPVAHLAALKLKDKYFHDRIVKWTANYLCDEHHKGIANFSQALRVEMDARRRLAPKELRKIAAYLRKNIPPKRGAGAESIDSDDDE